jgi:hypothetical protein
MVTAAVASCDLTRANNSIVRMVTIPTSDLMKFTAAFPIWAFLVWTKGYYYFSVYGQIKSRKRANTRFILANKEVTVK